MNAITSQRSAFFQIDELGAEEIALISGGDGIADTLGGFGLAGGTAAGAGAYFEIGALVVGGTAVAGVAAAGLIGYGIYEIATSK